MYHKYLVSVIVPCYNKEKLLHITLNSLIQQTIFNKLEIICIDDCSQDRTRDILYNYSDKYKNIKVFENKNNINVFATRLRGIELSNGEYIGFIDPDDKCDKGWFEELYYKAKKTNADIIQSPSVIKWNGSNYSDTKKWYQNMENNIYKITSENITDIVKDNWMTLWNRLFKTEVLKEILILPRYNINFLEDMLIYWCALVNSSVICNYKTTSNLYYNLSDDVEHLSHSNAENRKQPTASVFNLIDSYIIQKNRLDFCVHVKRWRKYYITEYAGEFNTMFNNEFFGVSDKERNRIIRTYEAILNSL